MVGLPLGSQEKEEHLGKEKDLASVPRRGQVWVGPSFSTGVLPVAPLPFFTEISAARSFQRCLAKGSPSRGSKGRRNTSKGHWSQPLSVGLPQAGCLPQPKSQLLPRQHPHTSLSLQVLLTTCRLSPFAPSRLGGSEPRCARAGVCPPRLVVSP